MPMTREATFEVLSDLTSESVRELTGMLEGEVITELPAVEDIHVDRLEAFFASVGIDDDGMADYFDVDVQASLYLMKKTQEAGKMIDLNRFLHNQGRAGFELGIRYALWAVREGLVKVGGPNKI